MGEYDSLEKFTLVSHGDHWEQKWAPLVLKDFPAYEVFWRRYVVPLTNRIDPAIPPSDRDRWIRLRESISASLEQVTMHHYSVFYYLARATERIQAGDSAFPEDVFSLLDACADNVFPFFEKVSSFLSDFGRTIRLPKNAGALTNLSKDLGSPYPGGFVSAKKYRDVILHNPVLGRSIDRGRTSLPKSDTLEAVKLSWRKAANLPPEELVELRPLFLRLHREICEFLQDKWQIIISALDAVRESPKFKIKYKLENFFPVSDPTPLLIPSQGIAASGSQVYSATTNVAVISSSAWIDLSAPTAPALPEEKNETLDGDDS